MLSSTLFKIPVSVPVESMLAIFQNEIGQAGDKGLLPFSAAAVIKSIIHTSASRGGDLVDGVSVAE